MGKRDRTIVILGGSIDHLMFLRAAKDLGIQTVVLDRDPKCVCRAEADAYIPTNLLDFTRICNELDLLADTTQITGVFTYSSDAEIQVISSKVRQRYNCPGPDPVVGDILTDKESWKYQVVSSGISTPKFVATGSRIEALEFIWSLDRAVVKPTIGSAGSMGVRLLNKPNEETASESVDHSMSMSANGRILIEEYMPGEEYTVDCIVGQAEIVLISVARKRMKENRLQGYTVDYTDDAISPAGEQFRQIARTATKIIDLLMLESTMMSIDLIRANDAYYIIDVGLLMDSKIDHLLYRAGYDIYNAWCKVCTGLGGHISARRDRARKYQYYRQDFLYALPNAENDLEIRFGREHANAFIEKQFERASFSRTSGTTHDQLGWIMTGGDDRQRVDQLLNQYLRKDIK